MSFDEDYVDHSIQNGDTDSSLTSNLSGTNIGRADAEMPDQGGDADAEMPDLGGVPDAEIADRAETRPFEVATHEVTWIKHGSVFKCDRYTFTVDPKYDKFYGKCRDCKSLVASLSKKNWMVNGRLITERTVCSLKFVNGLDGLVEGCPWKPGGIDHFCLKRNHMGLAKISQRKIRNNKLARRKRSANSDISGMVYNEEEIDAMIAKVNTYLKSNCLQDIASDIGYSQAYVKHISNFLKKEKSESVPTTLSVLKRLQLFFEKLEAAGNVVEPEHPLQGIVDQLTRENERQKKLIETLEFIVDLKDEKIEELEKGIEQSPNLRVDPSTFYETPVKVEVSSQSSQNTLDRNAKEAHLVMLKNRLREIVADLREKRRRRTWKTYLIVDENGKGIYAGMTGQELKKRIIGHMNKRSKNKKLRKWISTQQHLTAYTIHEGSEEECALVESLLINLRHELGFDLVNIRKEKSRTETPTKLVDLDDEGEISVISECLPMNADDKGHDQLVAGVRLMVEKAMEQSPVRQKRQSKAAESDEESESDEQSDEESESDEQSDKGGVYNGPSPKKRRILSP